jgi:hypothetical protein
MGSGTADFQSSTDSLGNDPAGFSNSFDGLGIATHGFLFIDWVMVTMDFQVLLMVWGMYS